MPRPIKKKLEKKRKPDHDSGDDLNFPLSNRAAHSKKHFKPSNLVKVCFSCSRRFYPSSQENDCSACSGVQALSKRPAKKIIKKLKADVSDSDIPSLKHMCINLIADHIQDVEDFGFISLDVKRRLSQIISRQRSLSDTIIDLFLDPQETELCLYDCTLISEKKLLPLSFCCPGLVRLDLSYCGRMSDQVLDAFASFKHLTNLKLGGSFLVSQDGVARFFEAIGSNLEFLAFQEAVQVSDKSIESLVKNATKLKSLTLKRCPKITSEGISSLSKLSLSTLKLIEVGSQVSDESLSQVIDKQNCTLTEVTLSGYVDMGDSVLVSLAKCNHLRKASIKNAASLTNDALTQFFAECPSLSKLNLHRISHFSGAALNSVLKYHAHLTHLDINGLDDLKTEDFKSLSFNKLEYLDLSLVRCVNDDLIIKLCQENPLLILKAYGCPEISPLIIDNDLKNSLGQSIKIYGNEFA